MSVLTDYPVVLRADTGEALELDLGRWHDPATDEEADLLDDVGGPVIDLGCGPGRLVVHLASQRIVALGVDSSPSAIALARMRGANVLEGDLFAALPDEGRWSTALLFDGNIGIGGDPVRLLRRCGQLLAADGSVLVELGAPGGCSGVHRVRLEHGAEHGPWFIWSVVTVDAIVELASAARLHVRALHRAPEERRWFAHLVKDTDASALA
jgi:SAM-dependent methyltransferase